MDLPARSGLPLRRVLKYFNIAVAVALSAAAFAVYWVAWRPLPKTSGTIAAPIADRAAVARDSIGVPHITAGSIEDALFLQAYVTAQDRLWQMDLLRRLAAGRLAEILGPRALELDRESRRFRTQRIADYQSHHLDPRERAVLAAYARGVNYFVETHRGRLPLEFTLLGYDPMPWTVSDSLLVGLFMYRVLTNSWRAELEKAALMAGGEPDKVDFLFPTRAGAEVSPGGGLPGGGSNAWVLAGSRTATGKPLLANDPHLDYSIPGIWYMVGLRAPGLNVTGVSFPGVPCVILGHNDRIAWGATNLQFDVEDFYVERLDPQTGRYLFRGQPAMASLDRETIRVRGHAPVEFTQWLTRHGPVMFGERGQALALRWTAAEPSGFSFPLLELDRARNWQEFTAALSRYDGPAQNWVYADVDSNIGYQVAGRLPIRRNFSGDVPVDGSSGQFEWDGFIPFEQLPRVFNPPSGVIVTANQNPFPADYPYRVSGFFDAPYRSREILTLLTSRGKWRVGDMLPVQKDVYSPFLDFVARQVTAAYDRRGAANPSLADAIALLRGWNGQMEPDQAAPLLAELIYEHLRTSAGERASPGKGALYDYVMAPAAVEKLLRTRPAGWFPDYDQLILRSFVDAVEQGRRMQGRDVRKWKYGAYNRLLIAHPVGHNLPLVARYFDIGPVAMSGSHTTIKQFVTIRATGAKAGPSMRMAIDCSDFDKSYQNVVAGESGQVLSPHYKDQWEAYYFGAHSFPMQFRHVEAEDTLTVEPVK